MISTIHLSDKNKKILLIIGAAALCLLVASTVYASLKIIAPKNNHIIEEPADVGQDELTAEEQSIRDADVIFQAGQDAFNTGKSEEAIAKLNDAKRLYGEAGNTMKAEQTMDYLSFVEQETRVEETEQQKLEASPDDNKTTNNP